MDKGKLTVHADVFTQTVEQVVSPEELKNVLRLPRPLRIKHGIDATAPDLHIGHAVSLWKIRALQEQGHCAVILFGDVTTAIGDPTGRSKSRPILDARTIKKNIRSLERQMKRVLIARRGLLEIHRSSEWYGRMSAADLIKLLSSVTHARLIERDMFQERMRSGSEIYMHELIYPVLQGYDSVMLRSDLTIIGSDQLFNEHVGRLLQEKSGQPPQVIVTVKLLPGLDGQGKMSKSSGNYISLVDTPTDKFGKIMRVPDALIVPYLEAYTDAAPAKIVRIARDLRSGANPMDAKLFLAETLVRRYHGGRRALAEREKFLALFSRRELPQGISRRALPTKQRSLTDLLIETRCALSKTEARRLILQGAVEVDGVRIADPRATIAPERELVLRVGKRHVIRVQFKSPPQNKNKPPII